MLTMVYYQFQPDHLISTRLVKKELGVAESKIKILIKPTGPTFDDNKNLKK